MKDKILLNEELKGLSPWLHDLKQRGDGFQVPEGYFDTLEDSVFSRIDAAGNRRAPGLTAKKGGGFFSLRAISAAAAVLAVVLAATWLFRGRPAELPAAVVPELSEEEIELYVLENIRDFDPAQLASLSPEETEALPPAQPESQRKTEDLLDELSEEELELLLKEMSDEELENML